MYILSTYLAISHSLSHLFRSSSPHSHSLFQGSKTLKERKTLFYPNFDTIILQNVERFFNGSLITDCKVINWNLLIMLGLTNVIKGLATRTQWNTSPFTLRSHKESRGWLITALVTGRLIVTRSKRNTVASFFWPPTASHPLLPLSLSLSLSRYLKPTPPTHSKLSFRLLYISIHDSHHRYFFLPLDHSLFTYFPSLGTLPTWS